MDSFTLSRNWFNFSFENPELINPTHTAILFFAIEHCNRLGGKEKFGFPTQMTMDAIGIKKHQTYIKYLNDLVNWGFIKMIQKSTNQYSSNIISLIYAMPKKGKALDKAFIKHGAKQTVSMGQSTGQSKDSIDKQVNKETIIYNEFYDEQLLLSDNDENYETFIKILFGDNEDDKVLNGVLSIKEQLTYNEFLTCLEYAEKFNTKIGDKLLKIENNKKYYKGVVSLNRTLKNWLSNRFVK